MTHTPEDREPAVRTLIDRLFDDEPPHRPGMAETSIAYGASAARRRGYTVAVAAVGVLAVAAGAVAVVDRVDGAGNDWTLHPGDGATVSASTYEDQGPTYADKVREIDAELPGLLNPLLPSSMLVRYKLDQPGGPMSSRTGDVSPDFALQAGTTEYVLQFDADGTGYEEAFAHSPAAVPVPVKNGTIRVRTLPSSGASGEDRFSTWFEFKPSDPSKPALRMLVYGNGKTGPLDAAAAKKLVDAQGFAAITALLDPATPASAAVVRQRHQIEDRINAEAARVLPPGFRLKLSPAIPGTFELVGPHGVDTFLWQAEGGGTCLPQGALCYSYGYQPARTVGPDGKPRLGVYSYLLGGGKATTVNIMVLGKPALGMDTDPAALGKPVETAPQGPGLTPQEAMAIMKAPGLTQVIADAQQAIIPVAPSG